MDDRQRVDIRVFADDECETVHAQTGPTSRLYHLCAGVEGGGKGQCTVGVIAACLTFVCGLCFFRAIPVGLWW